MKYSDIHIGDVLIVGIEDNTYRYKCINKIERMQYITVQIVCEYNLAERKHFPIQNGSMFTVSPDCFCAKIKKKAVVL